MTFRCVLLVDQYRLPNSQRPPMMTLTASMCSIPDSEPKLPDTRDTHDRFAFDPTPCEELIPPAWAGICSGAFQWSRPSVLLVSMTMSAGL